MKSGDMSLLLGVLFSSLWYLKPLQVFTSVKVLTGHSWVWVDVQAVAN